MGGGAADAREAIRRADSAMYEAKRAGGDRCAFFRAAGDARGSSPPGRARAPRRRDPRRARHRVPAGVRARDAEIAGVEALLRWDSPTLGSVPPAEFIPVAEDTGRSCRSGAGSCARAARPSADRRAGRAAGRAVGERLRAPARPSGLRTVGPADPVSRRVPRRPARARDHRGGAGPRRCGHCSHAARARVRRDPDRARRLRHRLCHRCRG